MSAGRPLWFNGELMTAERLALDPGDRGLLLGDGAFETIPVISGKAFRLDAHIDRLMSASDGLGLGLERVRIEQAADAVLRTCAGAGILRLTATRGPAGRGLAAKGTPSLLATLAPWPALVLGEPLRLVTATVRRNDQSPASRLKTLSYLDNILAAREAAAQGADDALMCNTRGNPACSTISNLFIVIHGRLITPPVSEGVLPGITRKLALERDDAAEERAISADELPDAEEIFLTNSIRLVRPVAHLDGRHYPRRHRALQILEKLKALIKRECGELPML